MFERFTSDARDVVVLAQEEARALRHGHIGTEHLLLSILTTGEGTAHEVLTAAGIGESQVRQAIQRPSRMDAEALESIGIDLDAVRAKVEATFGPGALDEVPAAEKKGWFGKWHRPFTARARKVLELALREALALKHDHIGTEHLLLGLIREGQGLAAKIITDEGVALPELKRMTLENVGPRAGGPRA